MKFSILAGLVAVSTVFASVIRKAADVPLEHENHISGNQWQDVNNLNERIVLQGGVYESGSRGEGHKYGSGNECLKPIPKSIATISAGNLRSGCVGGSIKPDYEIFKGVLCAFSRLELEPKQPKHGVRACTVSPKTGQKWCATCFAHNDAAPEPSISVWDRLTKPQQASVCLDTIIHTSLYGFGANQCVNTLATSIYGPIGVHSYISN
ncbi:hypothetical protein AYI68_g4287 [Smittium mucronatum]|uniref:Uncharacterized protein n=1 Tax=Smittium mucronatum TaxID=133383 RepID=A0A1R0GXN6_9FUNG|nr:hypothetical protein AYI68_g4287 [Smittium mucronatum]